MTNIIETLTTNSNLASVFGWIVLAFAATLGACIIDLFAGLYKAWKSGVARTSTGLRKTCQKCQHYFLPMICLAFADMLAASLINFAPFSMLWAAFCICCEFKSVLEKSSTKDEIREAANTIGVVVKNKDDLAKMFKEILQETACEKQPKKAGKKKADGEGFVVKAEKK